MLARRSILEHPLGATIEMPRLIPAFSSKGFPFYHDKETGREISEVSDALELSGPIINDSILVSAYDISHGFLRDPERFFDNKELVFIDSGGYELSSDFDSTEPIQDSYTPDKNYDLQAYREVLGKLPTDCQIAITNFDHQSRGKSIEEQIREAQTLFNDFPKVLHDFIIKPTGQANYLYMDEIEPHIAKMRSFHIVGITEKELGNTLLDRLVNIAQLRSSMNRKSVNAPIHVWGGLDPVMTPLYFLAGAEIFDGISWLRYGYSNDAAISREAYIAIELGVQTQWRRAVSMRLGNNISYLENLTIRMRTFVDEGGHDFNTFGIYADALKNAYKALCTKVPELKGGT